MGLANASPINCLISQPKEIMYSKLIIPALALAALSFSVSFLPIAHAAESLPDIFHQSQPAHLSALSVSSTVSTNSFGSQELQNEIDASSDAKIAFERTLVTSQPAPPVPQPVEEPADPVITDTDVNYVANSDEESRDRVEQSTAGLAPWQISQLNAQKNYIATQTDVPYAVTAPTQAKGAEIVKIAETRLGVPYVWGGVSPTDGWDCSGYVQWVFGQAGIKLPRTSQWVNGKKIDPTDALPGDLVVQNNGTHVGIYLGNGQMLSALNPTVGTLEHSTSIMKADYYRIS